LSYSRRVRHRWFNEDCVDVVGFAIIERCLNFWFSRVQTLSRHQWRQRANEQKQDSHGCKGHTLVHTVTSSGVKRRRVSDLTSFCRLSARIPLSDVLLWRMCRSCIAGRVALRSILRCSWRERLPQPFPCRWHHST
jgi:hypothetical protein